MIEYLRIKVSFSPTRCGVTDSQVLHSWKMLHMASWQIGAGKLGVAVPLPTCCAASGCYPDSFHLIFMYFYNQKKSPMPDSRAPKGPIHNISLIIQMIQMEEDLSAEARSEGCRSPRRDAAHALLIGRWSWPMKQISRVTYVNFLVGNLDHKQ